MQISNAIKQQPGKLNKRSDQDISQMPEKLWLDFLERQKISVYSEPSRPSLGLIQSQKRYFAE